jgi:ribonuclease P protein component
MLPKKNRLDTKTVEKVFKMGVFTDSPVFSFRFIKNPKEESRISFIVPKTLSKKAVERSKLRRLGYTALDKCINELPSGLSGAFVFKKKNPTQEEAILSIKTVFKKI